MSEMTTADFQALDKLDEDQILAELQGAVLADYVYSFRQGGKQVTGLSWAGVKSIGDKMGISTDLLQVVDTPESWAVICKSSRDNIARIGAAEQPKQYTTRQGEVKDDPFALTKAVSKAQRNAIRAQIPEKEILDVVKTHARTAAPVASTSRPAPAPKTNGNGNPPTSGPQLLDLVNSRVQVPYDNVTDMRNAIAQEAGLTEYKFPKANEIEKWREAYQFAKAGADKKAQPELEVA